MHIIPIAAAIVAGSYATRFVLRGAIRSPIRVARAGYTATVWGVRALTLASVPTVGTMMPRRPTIAEVEAGLRLAIYNEKEASRIIDEMVRADLVDVMFDTLSTPYLEG